MSEFANGDVSMGVTNKFRVVRLFCGVRNEERDFKRSVIFVQTLCVCVRWSECRRKGCCATVYGKVLRIVEKEMLWAQR